MKKLALVLVLALILAMTTACAGGTGGQAASGSTGAAQPDGSTQPAGGESTGKDSLVIAVGTDPLTFDQFNAFSMLEQQISGNIYDNLQFYDADNNPQPALAESYEISDDGLVYTFKLRQDVTFHNGEPFTSDDVAFTIEYGRTTPNAAELLSIVENVETPDDYTVIITTSTFSAPFFAELCGDQFPIYNREAVEAVDTYGTEPVGTGAYKFVSHAAGDSVSFEANDSYFRGAPAIKSLTYRILSDAFTAGVALESGDVDIIWASDAATAATLEGNPDLVVEPIDNVRVNYLILNTEQAPFDNKLVRQAVNYAIDRETMQAIVDEGMSNIKDDMAMPWMRGYAETSVRYSLDVEKALALMAEAGYSPENPLEVSISCVTSTQKTAQIAQENLAAIGINATVDVLEFNTNLSNQQDGSFQISVGGFGMIQRDMDIMRFFYSSSMINILNYARYNNPEADTLLTEGRAAQDETERAAIYKELMDLLQEDSAYIILSNPHTIRPYNKNLQFANVYPNNMYIRDVSWS